MKRVADYELGRVIGQGAHGTFYLAAAPERLGVDADHVAVKVLDRLATDDDFRRFGNELQLFASVDSPYLAPLLDAGHQEGTLFYVTEYFPLGSLEEPTEPISRDDALRAVAHAARGAHALHEVGVAHRDIKPANVLLRQDGAVLGDLGLAQVLDPGLTATGTGPIGPIEFMDPAVARGATAGRATDIWALGAVLHHALTGESVFRDIPTDSVLAALRHILDTPPRIEPDVDPVARSLIVQCVSADVEQRPATAEVLADHIEALL